MNTKYSSITCLLLAISCVSMAQNNQGTNEYNKLPISGFFFPHEDLNKATYIHLDDKGNRMDSSVWNRYYFGKQKQLTGNQNLGDLTEMYSIDIVDEYIVNSQITSSILQHLIVTDKSIQIIGESVLVSLVSKQEKKYPKSVILLAKPISKSISSEWQRIEEDGEIISSVSSFVDYNYKGSIIPCIKVKETTVLKNANINVTMEYYYLYGYGLMASAIYNKTLKTFVFFDKMSNLVHDTKLDEQKSIVKESGSNLIKNSKGEEAYINAKQMPEFTGGMAALGQYLQKNLRYPVAAQKAKVSGRVFVSFIVDIDGSLTDVFVLKGLGSGTDEEAIRIIKSMPKWQPGKIDGKPIAIKFNLPINFTLE